MEMGRSPAAARAGGALHRPAGRRPAEHGRDLGRVLLRQICIFQLYLLQVDDRDAARARRNRDVDFGLLFFSSFFYGDPLR